MNNLERDIDMDDSGGGYVRLAPDTYSDIKERMFQLGLEQGKCEFSWVSWIYGVCAGIVVWSAILSLFNKH